MREVVILGAARTIGGQFGGSFQNLTAPELGAAVVRESIKRSGITPDVIDQTIFGNAWQAGVGPNPARLSSVMGGVPVEAPAVTVNVRCGSSIQALIFGAQAIKAGDVDTVLVGGTESASQIPYGLPRARWGYRMGNGQLIDLMHKDGFRCPLGGGLMGEITEWLAEEKGISRQEQDAFAAESHNRAEAAVREGRFLEEIVPVEVKGKKGELISVIDEEIYRKGVTAESLSKLPPVFKKGGSITAGNACALCDAASAVVLMDRAKAQAMGLKPMALLRGYSFVGSRSQALRHIACESHSSGAQKSGPYARRYRPGRIKRGIRRPVHCLRAGPRSRPPQGQCPWGSYCPGTPCCRYGHQAAHYVALCDEAARCSPGDREYVHWRG